MKRRPLFWFASIRSRSHKRVNTHTQNISICVFCLYLIVVKHSLSSWLSVQTLNNFKGKMVLSTNQNYLFFTLPLNTRKKITKICFEPAGIDRSAFLNILIGWSVCRFFFLWKIGWLISSKKSIGYFFSYPGLKF